MDMRGTLSIDAEPYEFEFVPARSALVIIDMQRDFLEPGGFGEMLGNDVSQLRRTIEPNRRLLRAWRDAGLQVIHTREGHRPDLTDLPARQEAARSRHDHDRRLRPHGAHPGSRRGRSRHHPRALLRSRSSR